MWKLFGVFEWDLLADQVRRARDRALRRCEAERRATEPELEHLLGLCSGVQQQVPAGDADVEGPLADVDRDVARTQVEELDAVARVAQRELLEVAALGVAGLAEHLGRGLAQRPLVGYGDAQRIRLRVSGHGCLHRCA